MQGYSIDAPQDSDVGGNAIEIDEASAPEWQPVTTSTMRNFTDIGQPIDGDGLTAWYSNARVPFRNCIFMDGGEQVARLDDTGSERTTD